MVVHIGEDMGGPLVEIWWFILVEIWLPISGDMAAHWWKYGGPLVDLSWSYCMMYIALNRNCVKFKFIMTRNTVLSILSDS